MAGTPHGTIEHIFATVNQAQTRDTWVRLFNMFEAATAWTLIASQFGLAATGFDLTGGANPAGENAFAVWRNARMHILLQWAHTSVFGIAPGNPGDQPITDGVAIQMAYDTSGGVGIWAGGTGAAGADSKGTPVWQTSGGSLIVHPRANGSGGTFGTNFEACAQATQTLTVNSRFSAVHDDDYIAIVQDTGDDGSYNRILYLGPYLPAPGVVVTGEALVMYQFVAAPVLDVAIGSLTNASSTSEGGVAEAAGTTRSRILRVDLATLGHDVLHAPNPQKAANTHDAQALAIYTQDAEGAGSNGLLGHVDEVKYLFNVLTHNTPTGLLKAYFGNSTPTSVKVELDWDGATTPGSGVTEAGVQF
jgi:hypothetical protein